MLETEFTSLVDGFAKGDAKVMSSEKCLRLDYLFLSIWLKWFELKFMEFIKG